MSDLNQNQWNELWRKAGPTNDVSSRFTELVGLYSEPNRHYHNCRHIAECLAEFAPARELAREPLAVEFAIWFHDAIYDPRAPDNEERSAALARQWIDEAGLDCDLGDAVVQLVLATKQHDGTLHPDAPLLVDIDLSILGKPPERFWEYERQIRLEYEWVPEKIFNEKRAEILEGFLRRKALYHAEYFLRKYEQTARTNLAASVQMLRRG